MPFRFRIEDPALAGPLRQIEQLVRRAGGGLGWDECYEKQLDGIFSLLGDGLAFTRQRLGLSHLL